MQAALTGWDIRSLYTFPFAMLGVFLVLLLVPVINLLRRTGHHPAWNLLAILPLLNFIAADRNLRCQYPTYRLRDKPGTEKLDTQESGYCPNSKFAVQVFAQCPI